MTTPSPRLDGGHTPGPWACERDLSHFDTLTTVVGGCSRKGYLSRELIVQVGGYAGPSEAEANARLIAAAPDGLEFAEWIAYHWENQDMNHETFRVEAFRRAEKFITRAKGKDHA